MIQKENITSKKGRITTILGTILILMDAVYFIAPMFIETKSEPNNTAMIITLIAGGLFIIAPDKFVSIAKTYLTKTR